MHSTGLDSEILSNEKKIIAHISQTFERVEKKSSHSHNLCDKGEKKYLAEKDKERSVKQ